MQASQCTCMYKEHSQSLSSASHTSTAGEGRRYSRQHTRLCYAAAGAAGHAAVICSVQCGSQRSCTQAGINNRHMHTLLRSTCNSQPTSAAALQETLQKPSQACKLHAHPPSPAVHQRCMDAVVGNVSASKLLLCLWLRGLRRRWHACISIDGPPLHM